MRKLLLALSFTLLSFLFFPLSFRLAATTIPSPSLTPSPTTDEQINQDLQERIASRVAQLKLVEKRGIIGTVTDVSDTQITINDINGNTRFIDVDELTKFSSPSAQASFGISDIVKGATIGTYGLYNKESQRILARFVDVLVLPVEIDGAIESIDSTNFTLQFVDENNKTYTVEIEDVTKTSSYTSDGGLVKSGFSHLTVGQRLLAIGFFDNGDMSKIIASRLIVFPSLPITPQISLAPQAVQTSGTVTPSVGGGKKLTPIIK